MTIIIKTRVDSTSYKDSCDRIENWIKNQQSGYIVAANVHVVMSAYWNQEYKNIVNNAILVTPDGMPLVWGMGMLGVKKQSRVYGPDLMLAWCDRAQQLESPIYLYGGTSSMLIKLEKNLKQWFPKLIIAGSHAPPFRALTTEEERQDVERINNSGAKVIFVALGCPKQEEWMARQLGKVQGIMVGVGAAFSFHSGEVSQAPRWMMKSGLEWLYRLSTEPKRLWQRYLINNPIFVILFSLQLISYKLNFVKKNPE